jgi:hypothetical protein
MGRPWGHASYRALPPCWSCEWGGAQGSSTPLILLQLMNVMNVMMMMMMMIMMMMMMMMMMIMKMVVVLLLSDVRPIWQLVGRHGGSAAVGGGWGGRAWPWADAVGHGGQGTTRLARRATASLPGKWAGPPEEEEDTMMIVRRRKLMMTARLTRKRTSPESPDSVLITVQGEEAVSVDDVVRLVPQIQQNRGDNYSLWEVTPFDVAVNRGKVRPLDLHQSGDMRGDDRVSLSSPSGGGGAWGVGPGGCGPPSSVGRVSSKCLTGLWCLGRIRR